jgi:hypothetical protein
LAIPAGGRRRLTPQPHAAVTEGAALARQRAKAGGSAHYGLAYGPAQEEGEWPTSVGPKERRGSAHLGLQKARGGGGLVGPAAKNQGRGGNKGFSFSFMR